ncbi:hypothetical protein [Saccharothrix obliqua]|uniref:hypothetical protein n=1 Tax=Saccharothrix obliqua TaxID=2861747 RepID=UPI001C5E0DF3|nr:hypothetical protein [Saccharothrix obliqua]MBW4722000.1 hypothetical protein [Saccharothrix obliqua]
MDQVEHDLWVSFREAQVMEHTDARTALLEEVVFRADIGDVRRATFLSRRLLADAYRLDGRWDEVFRLFRECLAEYDHRPERFERDDEAALLVWYAWLVACMVDFPDMSLAEITAALDDVERRFRAAGLGLHEVHAARREVAAHVGDWETAEHAYQRWVATADVTDDDRWLVLTAVEQLLARGDAARACELARPVLEDPSAVDPVVVRARSLVLLPTARAGDLAQAAVLYRRLLRGMAGEFHSLEDHGRIVEFCALTGNEDAGVDWLGPMTGFEQRRRPFATMDFATSVAVLAGRLVAIGRGETELDLGDDPNSAAFGVLAERMRGLALDLADRFDRRNGTSTQGDRVRARLAARPLADHVRLSPTNRRPLPTRPPAGLTTSAMLDRAEWHDLRCEPDEARACLAVPDDLPEPLAARLAELRAKFFQDEETEARLRWAAEVHHAHGDLRRWHLNHAWLGLLVVHLGRAAEGLALTSDAVAGLRVLGDDTDCAWGEHWLVHVLAGLGRMTEADEALRRGLRHAGDDLLARGSLLLLEATLFPERVGAARAALEAFVAGDVPEKALEALALLENAGRWQDLVDPLPDWVVERGDRLAGRLRYLRAVTLIEAGRTADAVEDLNEAIGQASLRPPGATVEQWFQLAHANHAAGLHEDAVDAGLRAANWLDHLRDTEDASWAEWADRARYVVAESYRLLGDDRAALREYRRLSDGDGPLAAAAFVAGSRLLETAEG